MQADTPDLQATAEQSDPPDPPTAVAPPALTDPPTTAEQSDPPDPPTAACEPAPGLAAEPADSRLPEAGPEAGRTVTDWGVIWRTDGPSPARESPPEERAPTLAEWPDQRGSVQVFVPRVSQDGLELVPQTSTMGETRSAPGGVAEPAPSASPGDIPSEGPRAAEAVSRPVSSNEVLAPSPAAQPSADREDPAGLGTPELQKLRASLLDQLGRPQHLASPPAEPQTVRARIIAQLDRPQHLAAAADKPGPSRNAPNKSVPAVALTGAPPPVTPDVLAAALFDSEVDRLVLTRALADFDHATDDQRRIRGAKALASVRHELAVRALARQLLGDPSPRVRSECVTSLAAAQARKCVPVLELALQDPSPLVRMSAIRTLYRLQSAEAAPSLVRMLADEDDDVRHRAATCLAWSGHMPDANALLPRMRHSDDAAAILGSLLALRKANPKWELPGAVLARAIDLLDDPVEEIRTRAFALLRHVAPFGPEPMPQGEAERRALIARLRDWLSTRSEAC